MKFPRRALTAQGLTDVGAHNSQTSQNSSADAGDVSRSPARLVLALKLTIDGSQFVVRLCSCL